MREGATKLPKYRPGVVAEEEDRDNLIWTPPTTGYLKHPEDIRKLCGTIRSFDDITAFGIDNAPMAKKQLKRAQTVPTKLLEKPKAEDAALGDPSSSSCAQVGTVKSGAKSVRTRVVDSKNENRKSDAPVEQSPLFMRPITRRTTRILRAIEATSQDSPNGSDTAKKTTNKETLTGKSASPKKVRPKKADAEVDPDTYSDVVAKLPPFRSGMTVEEEDRDQLIWSANPDDAVKVQEFVREVVDSSGIGIDRALYNLQLHAYNTEEAKNAIAGMQTCRPVPWSKEETDLFRRAFAAYGKNFSKIHEIIPQKSIAEIVSHYYTSKPYEQYKASAKNIGPDEVDFGDSDDEGSVRRGNCLICTKDRHLYNLGNGMVCKSCKVYKMMMEEFDEELADYDYFDAPPKRVVNCPKGMEGIVDAILNKNASEPISLAQFEDLKAKELEKVKARVAESFSEGMVDWNDLMARKPAKYGFYFLKFDRPPTVCQTETRLRKEQVSETIKRCEKLEAEIEADYANLQVRLQEVERARPRYAETKPPRSRNTPDWTLDEKKYATSALVRYGLDFEAASAIVRTKTPEMVEIFYKKHKNELDAVISKHRGVLNKEVDDVTSKFLSTL